MISWVMRMESLRIKPSTNQITSFKQKSKHINNWSSLKQILLWIMELLNLKLKRRLYSHKIICARLDLIRTCTCLLQARMMTKESKHRFSKFSQIIIKSWLSRFQTLCVSSLRLHLLRFKWTRSCSIRCAKFKMSQSLTLRSRVFRIC